MKLLQFIVITALFYHSHQWDETAVTSNPNRTAPPSLAEIRNEVIEFEASRSFTFSTIEGKVQLEDVNSLCNEIADDPDVNKGLQVNRNFHFIPIRPSTEQYGLPIFTIPCFGWMRKRCAGTARPPFDYRCHYWMPYYKFMGDNLCIENATPDLMGKRKRRDANHFDAIVVSGLEAVTLCATSDQIPKAKTFTLDAIAIPTNEGSELRCINWSLSPEGGWTKERLSEEGCQMLNNGRPRGYIVNEMNNGIIEPLFQDIITCESRGKIVDCVFSKNNVEE